MQQTKFFCDKCGKEVTRPGELNDILVWYKKDISHMPNQAGKKMDANIQGEFCHNCEQVILDDIRILFKPSVFRGKD